MNKRFGLNKSVRLAYIMEKVMGNNFKMFWVLIDEYLTMLLNSSYLEKSLSFILNNKKV